MTPQNTRLIYMISEIASIHSFVAIYDRSGYDPHSLLALVLLAVLVILPPLVDAHNTRTLFADERVVACTSRACSAVQPSTCERCISTTARRHASGWKTLPGRGFGRAAGPQAPLTGYYVPRSISCRCGGCRLARLLPGHPWPGRKHSLHRDDYYNENVRM